MAERKKELKSLLERVKEESNKASLKLTIQNIKTIASSSITSWQIHGGKVKVVADFIFLGSKITANSDCSHEIKRCILLGRKSMTKLDTVLQSRNIILLTNIHLVKTMVFPVVM